MDSRLRPALVGVLLIGGALRSSSLCCPSSASLTGAGAHRSPCDVFFFAGYLAILVGGLREVVANQRAAIDAAVLEERGRIARDLHDGLAQDLAYPSMQAQRGAQRDERTQQISPIAGDEALVDEGSVGIRGMSERAERLGGWLAITSSPGRARPSRS